MSSGPPFGGSRQDQLVGDLLARGVALRDQGRVDEAIAELEVAYRLAPALAAKEYARTLLAQGSAQETVGDRTGAVSTYQRALEVAPDGGLRTEIADIIRDLEQRDALPATAPSQRWPRRRLAVLVVPLLLVLGVGMVGAWQAPRFFGDEATPATTQIAAGSPGAAPTSLVPDEATRRTATAQAMSTAAAEGRELAAQAERAGDPIYGPRDEPIDPQQDGVPEPPFLQDFRQRLGGVADFRVQGRFVNPEMAAGESWDHGFVFRWQERDDQTHLQLFVTHDSRWELRLGTKDDSRPIVGGTLTNFDTAPGGANDLRLVAIGATGYFWVNGRFVALLDLSALTEPGWMSPATEMLDTDEGLREPTGVTGFTVWAIRP
jgi:hypothetical protein